MTRLSGYLLAALLLLIMSESYAYGAPACNYTAFDRTPAFPITFIEKGLCGSQWWYMNSYPPNLTSCVIGNSTPAMLANDTTSWTLYMHGGVYGYEWVDGDGHYVGGNGTLDITGPATVPLSFYLPPDQQYLAHTMYCGVEPNQNNMDIADAGVAANANVSANLSAQPGSPQTYAVTFNEQGLQSGTSTVWSITLVNSSFFDVYSTNLFSNSSQAESATYPDQTSLAFQLPDGTYDYGAADTSSKYELGSFTVNGAPVSITVSFTVGEQLCFLLQVATIGQEYNLLSNPENTIGLTQAELSFVKFFFPIAPYIYSITKLTGSCSSNMPVIPNTQGATSSTTTTTTSTTTSIQPNFNWAGYIVESNFNFPTNVITQINASWKVQHTTPILFDTGESTQWVGIGGITAGDNSLIQVGTFSNIFDGYSAYKAFYELIPNGPVYIDSFTINPGANDIITASIKLVNPNTKEFDININDKTTNQQFSTTIPYQSSSLASGEIIDEDPTSSAACQDPSCLWPFAHFGTAYFGPVYTDMPYTDYATVSGQSATIGTLPYEQIEMATAQKVTSTGSATVQTFVYNAIEVPSTLTDGTSFTVTQIGGS